MTMKDTVAALIELEDIIVLKAMNDLYQIKVDIKSMDPGDGLLLMAQMYHIIDVANEQVDALAYAVKFMRKE